MKVYDLDGVLITPSVQERWMAHLATSCENLLVKYPDLHFSELPDEQLGIEGERAFIFVDVRKTRIKMNIQSAEYRIIL